MLKLSFVVHKTAIIT